jgi:CheY-like chemotaxis protein
VPVERAAHPIGIGPRLSTTALALLVEDDATTAAGIKMMLGKENFICDTTDLGEDGLEIGKLYDYDIILLDLMLPDIDGYEVLRRLRAARVRTPILILSGLAELDQRSWFRRRRFPDQAVRSPGTGRPNPGDRATLKGPLGIDDPDRQATR